MLAGLDGMKYIFWKLATWVTVWALLHIAFYSGSSLLPLCLSPELIIKQKQSRAVNVANNLQQKRINIFKVKEKAIDWSIEMSIGWCVKIYVYNGRVLPVSSWVIYCLLFTFIKIKSAGTVVLYKCGCTHSTNNHKLWPLKISICVFVL